MEEIATVLLKTSRQTNHRIAVGRYCSAHIIVFLRSAVPKESTYGTDVIGAGAQQLLPDIITNTLLCNTFLMNYQVYFWYKTIFYIVFYFVRLFLYNFILFWKNCPNCFSLPCFCYVFIISVYLISFFCDYLTLYHVLWLIYSFAPVFCSHHYTCFFIRNLHLC